MATKKAGPKAGSKTKADKPAAATKPADKPADKPPAEKPAAAKPASRRRKELDPRAVNTPHEGETVLVRLNAGRTGYGPGGGNAKRSQFVYYTPEVAEQQEQRGNCNIVGSE